MFEHLVRSLTVLVSLISSYISCLGYLGWDTQGDKSDWVTRVIVNLQVPQPRGHQWLSNSMLASITVISYHLLWPYLSSQGKAHKGKLRLHCSGVIFLIYTVGFLGCEGHAESCILLYMLYIVVPYCTTLFAFLHFLCKHSPFQWGDGALNRGVAVASKVLFSPWLWGWHRDSWAKTRPAQGVEKGNWSASLRAKNVRPARNCETIENQQTV